MKPLCFSRNKKPEKRIVSYLKNNKEGSIREIMEEFTISERRKIVSRKVKGKSPLIYACEHNALKVVEYLIAECGADVQEIVQINGELLTPLFVAAKYGDPFLVDELIYLGADVSWTDNEDRNALVYACLNDNVGTAAALQKNIDINCIKNMNLCLENKSYLKRAFLLGAKSTYTDDSGNTILMKAVIQGKSDIVRTLQDYYINDYTRNNIGANALDLAIMRGDEKMKVILREKLFTLQDEILALEYCGARFILYNKLEMGKDLWEKSIDLRRKSSSNVIPKKIVRWKKLERMSVEFDTARGLEDIKDFTGYLLQAVLVYLRILSPKNLAAMKAIMHVISFKDIDDEDPLRFCLLNQLLAFNEDTENPDFTTVSLAINTALGFFQRHIENASLNNWTVNVNIFLYLVDFITLNVSVFLNEYPYEGRYHFIYKELLYTSLHYLEVILTEETGSVRSNAFIAAVRELACNNITGYPVYILHLAIEVSPYKVIALLLECGADVNAVDESGYTPLQLLKETYSHHADSEKAATMLMKLENSMLQNNLNTPSHVRY